MNVCYMPAGVCLYVLVQWFRVGLMLVQMLVVVCIIIKKKTELTAVIYPKVIQKRSEQSAGM